VPAKQHPGSPFEFLIENVIQRDHVFDVFRNQHIELVIQGFERTGGQAHDCCDDEYPFCSLLDHFEYHFAGLCMPVSKIGDITAMAITAVGVMQISTMYSRHTYVVIFRDSDIRFNPTMSPKACDSAILPTHSGLNEHACVWPE
jgi:hypothetical protein